MKKTIKIMAVAIGFATLMSSCGVMFGGSKYNGTIIAKDHPNAEIIVNGQKMGVGQVTSLFPRDKALQVELKQDGCATKTQNFDRKFRTGNFILSVISWGIIGIAVDLGTGASYKPDHSNPAVTKKSDKDYTFTVDYSDCKK